MNNVYIVHGYNATPSDHWFPALKKTIENENTTVEILEMPDSTKPKLESWLAYLKNNLTDLNENTVIVTHSLGVITALRYLVSISPRVRIKGLVLVSGFLDNLPNLPLLDEFTNHPLDVEAVKQITDQRFVLVSDNDPIVDPRLTNELAKKIDAHLTVIKDGGHFLADEGYKEFPQVTDIVKDLLAKG